MTRRTFLASAAAPLAAAPARLNIRKAVEFEMLPQKLSYADRFKLAVDVGFQEIECPTTPDEREAEAIKQAAESNKLRIHSVMNMAHWEYPLSSADPEVVAMSMKGMETSLRNARLWGADTVLLVPAVVDAKTSYKDAWVRSQRQIRKLIPLAQELKVIIAVEEVWNKFLQSPLEFARYVDDFNSPWVRAYFDVGNVVINGYPQDWIRTLNKRIVKLHLKDFRFAKDPGFTNMKAEFVNLREGEVDWKEVHRALSEIGYEGTATVELDGGDERYLRDVSHRVDLILQAA
jgi:L-ribulose-5-phosphate 3-epimerase